MKTLKSLGWITLVSLVLMSSAAALAQVLSVRQITGYHAGVGEINYAPIIGSGYGSDVTVSNGFESFCISRNAYIRIPGTYYAFVNTNGVYFPDNFTISKGTAWLYSQFAHGVLTGYRYAGAELFDFGHSLSARAEDAHGLQLAIWTLEGQYWYGAGPGPFSLVEDLGNPWLDMVATVFGGGTNGLLTAMGANNPGDYNVGVINLNYINDDGSVGAIAQPGLLWANSIAQRPRMV